MAAEIIIYAAKNNAKTRKRQKTGKLYAAKDANRALNKQLEKAFLTKENPRQKLAEFRSQIETNAVIYTAQRKKEERKNLSAQRFNSHQLISSYSLI